MEIPSQRVSLFNLLIPYKRRPLVGTNSNESTPIQIVIRDNMVPTPQHPNTPTWDTTTSHNDTAPLCANPIRTSRQHGPNIPTWDTTTSHNDTVPLFVDAQDVTPRRLRSHVDTSSSPCLLPRHRRDRFEYEGSPSGRA